MNHVTSTDVTFVDNDQPPTCSDTDVASPPGVAIDVVVTCTDPDGDPTTVTPDPPPYGTAAAVSANTIRVTPGTFGPVEHLTFHASDGMVDSNAADLTVVLPAPDTDGDGIIDSVDCAPSDPTQPNPPTGPPDFDCTGRPTPSPFIVADGPVRSVGHSTGRLYLAGEFGSIGPPTGSTALIDAATASLKPFPQIDGQVQVVVGDGSGGWYVAGTFNHAGNVFTQGLAHVFANGTVDPNLRSVEGFNPTAMVLLGHTLYVAGSFTVINNRYRPYVAAFDTQTGAVLPWSPRPDQEVRCLATDGASIFMGGDFSTVNGALHPQLVAVDPQTGAPTNWGGTIGNGQRITQLATLGSTLYVAGAFAQANGQSRDGLAAFDTQTGSLLPWAPTASNVQTLYATPTAVYVGGFFQSIDGDSRNGLAAVRPDTGTLLPFSAPLTFSSVSALAQHGTRLVIGGSFNLVADMPTPGIVEVDAVSGDTLARLYAGGQVSAASAQGPDVLVGGRFSTAVGTPRAGFAILNTVTHTLDPTELVGIGSANELFATDDDVYVGGTSGVADYNIETQAVRYTSTRNTVDGLTSGGAGTFYWQYGRSGGWFDNAHPPLWTAPTADLQFGIETAVVSDHELYVSGHGAWPANPTTNEYGIFRINPDTGRPDGWQSDQAGVPSALRLSHNTLYAETQGGWIQFDLSKPASGSVVADPSTVPPPAGTMRTVPFVAESHGTGFYSPSDNTAPTVHVTLASVVLANPKVLWSATDADGGVSAYDLRTSPSPTGPSANLLRLSTATSATLSLSPGQTMCASVRARDDADNISRWDTRCTTRAVDDTSMVHSKGWRRLHDASRLDRSASYTKAAGATLAMDATAARQVFVIARTCPVCGKFKVSIGTNWISTVDLRSRHDRWVVLKVGILHAAETGTLHLTTLRRGALVEIDGGAVTGAPNTLQ
jgi:hypothetical protein